MSFGKALSDFGSGLLAGPLGVVQIGYKGYDLGKTVDAATLKPDMDLKDIIYQQNGTKAADHVPTGCDWMISGSFGEINTTLLKIIAPYLFGSAGVSGGDSGTFKASLYESLLDNVAGVVKVAAVVDQTPSEEVEDTMFFYNGIFLINADLINWGADAQRNLPFEIRLKARQLSDAESTTYANKVVYGYYGDPTVEDVPAADWPDLDAPYVVSAVANSATEVVVTLNEDSTEISGVTSTERILISSEGKFIVPTSVAYATKEITLTLAAASIVSGDVVELFISADTFEDADSNANESDSGIIVTNSI